MDPRKPAIRLVTKETTSLQIYDVDPRLKNDTTATAAIRVFVWTTRLTVRPRRDGARAGHGWPPGLLFLKTQKKLHQFQNTPERKQRKRRHLVVFTDFANEVAERLVHVDALFGGCLDESAPEMFRKVATLCNHTTVRQSVVTSSVV